MTPRIRTVRDETGVALPLALFAIVTLSGLLLTFLSMAGMEPVIAQNHTSSSKAFYIADAGIEHALDALQSPGSPALPQVGKPLTLFPGQVFGSGSYSVTVSQNADGTFLLTSTGTYKEGTRIIRALVSLGNLPPPRGAAEILVDPNLPVPEGQKSKTEFDAEPGGWFDGRDWTAPADISACTAIAKCGTLMDPSDYPSTYGGFTNNKDHILQIANGGAVVGSDCSPPACSGTNAAGPVSQQTDTTVAFTRWDSFLDAATSRANQTVTGGASLTGTKAWGTAAAPEITVLKIDNPKFAWNAEVKGAGVLIIEVNTLSNISLRGDGGLNWLGLVIVRSEGNVEFEIGKEGGGLKGGAARIFGQVVNRSAQYAEIEFENKYSFVKYSSAAMNLVRGQFLPSLKGWQEVMQ